MQNNKLGAKRRKGFGEYGPQCPTGAVAKRLGVKGIAHTVRSDARGLGNTVPNAPPGLSRKGLGVKGIAHAVRSDAKGLGNPFPMPLRGCH